MNDILIFYSFIFNQNPADSNLGPYQCQFECGTSNMVDSKNQKFWPKINILKKTHCISLIQVNECSSKIGHDLKKMVQKLKLEKNVFYKKWSPKLIFLKDFFF